MLPWKSAKMLTFPHCDDGSIRIRRSPRLCRKAAVELGQRQPGACSVALFVIESSPLGAGVDALVVKEQPPVQTDDLSLILLNPTAIIRTPPGIFHLSPSQNLAFSAVTGRHFRFTW